MQRIEVYEINSDVKKIDIGEEQENNIKILFERFAESQRYNHLRVKYHLSYENRTNGTLLYDYYQSIDKPNFSLAKFAQRLCEAEKTLGGIRSKTITNGTLFIKETSSTLLMMKLEQTETVDKITYEIKGDFGTDENYYKLCVFNGSLDNVIVVDKSRKAAKYWFDKFLNLSLDRDSDKNTSDLIKLIDDNRLFNESIVQLDNYNDIVDKTKEYLFNNQQFDKTELMNKLNATGLTDVLVANELFSTQSEILDSEFEISVSEMKNRFKKTLNISNETRIVTDNFEQLKKYQGISFSGSTITLEVDENFINQIKEDLGEE